MTEKVGRLDVHLKLISKTSDRRKCSRSALPEVNVDKKVAGGKGSTNNYRYCPTSAGKKSTAMLIKPRTRFGVNVRKFWLDQIYSSSPSVFCPTTRWNGSFQEHHNDYPFILRILPNEAKICKDWSKHFCHRQRIIPHDFVLEQKKRYWFPTDGDWNKKQASNKEASRFYHADPSSVQPRFPYFSVAYIEIPQEAGNLLSESRESHWRNKFSLSCNDRAGGSKHDWHRMYKKLWSLLD